MNTLPALIDGNTRDEKFCEQMARHGDVALAVRVAYQAPNMTLRQARHLGDELLSRPEIATRVQAIVDQVRSLSPVNIATVLIHWWELANADPNEVVQYRRNCCRHCWGLDFRYQWTEPEFWEATQKAVEVGNPVPDAVGGFDFDKTRGPNPDCPQCNGEGVGEVHVTDSRFLSERGRLLYDGVEMTRTGLKVNLNSRTEALTNITKVLGMFGGVNVDDLNRKPGQEMKDLAEMPIEALTAKFREIVGARRGSK